MCCSTERHTAGHGRARPKRVRLDPTLRAPGRGAAGNGATQHTLPRSTARGQPRKRAPLSRRYRAFPWAREPNQAHTGTEGDPDNWPGRCCGPLPAQIGHDRCEQTVPAGTVCGRYLYTLCINKRGYHHDLTLTLPVHAAPSKSVFRSVRILARRTSASTLQTSESLSRTVANTCMKQNLRWAQTCFLHSVHGSSRRGSNSERLPWHLPPR